MPGGLGPRFALEAGFLVLLAVATGYAGLSPTAIVLVMGGGWVLVALVELLAWQEGTRLSWPGRGNRPDSGTPEAAAEAELREPPQSTPALTRWRRLQFWSRGGASEEAALTDEGDGDDREDER